MVGQQRTEVAARLAQMGCIHILQLAGKERARQRLEELLNAGVIGPVGAQRIYLEAFGAKLAVVKDKPPTIIERVFHRRKESRL